MALELKTDLIAGVLAAADPVRQRLATQRLEVMARGLGEPQAPAEPGTAVADTRSFADVVADLPVVRPEPPLPADIGAEEARVALLNRGAAGQPPETAAAAAARQFEAVALQSFIGAMMPPAAAAMAGGGTAGGIWSSLLTEHVAAAMARAGGIGIAAMLSPGQGNRQDQEPPRS